MKIELSTAEIERDLENTNSDILYLGNIVQGLHLFIQDNGDEDRSGFKTDLLKYETLLNHAKELRIRIQAALESKNS